MFLYKIVFFAVLGGSLLLAIAVELALGWLREHRGAPPPHSPAHSPRAGLDARKAA